MKTCPFCFKEDLAEQSTKCPHCAAWLTDSNQNRDRIEKLRQEVRQELKDDLKSHKDYLNNLLNRVQWSAGAILVLAIGAAAFFGIRTDQSITEITAAITDQAEKKITEKVENEIDSEKVKNQIEAKINLASQSIEKTINDSVAKLNTQAEQQVKEFTITSKDLFAKMAVLRERIEPAAEKLNEVAALADRAKAKATQTYDAISDATKSPIDKRLASLPIDKIEIGPKGYVSRIPEFIKQRINALRFELGQHGYYGPAIWQYFAGLSKLPEFRYAVILNQDHSLFGVFDALGLMYALNPPNTGELSAQYPVEGSDLPNENQVPMWTQFAKQLNAGNTPALKGYPGFVPRDKAISLSWDKQKVLNRMEDLGVEWLPVVDERRREFVGIIDRSRLTTSLVLEIAKRFQ